MSVFNLPVNIFFICTSCYSLLLIIILLFSIYKVKHDQSKFRMIFIMSIIKYFSISLLFLLIYMYSFGFVHHLVLIVVLFLNIIVQAIRITTGFTFSPLVDSQTFDFYESIQFLLVAFKGMHLMTFNWEYTLFIYLISSYILAFIGVFCLIVIFIIKRISYIGIPGSEQNKKMNLTIWAMYHQIWKGLSLFYIFQNFLRFLKKNGMNLNMNFSAPDPTFIPICIFYMVGGIINIIWFNKQKPYLKESTLRLENMFEDFKKIKIEIIKMPIDMRIIQTGANYFIQIFSDRDILKEEDYIERENLGKKKIKINLKNTRKKTWIVSFVMINLIMF